MKVVDRKRAEMAEIDAQMEALRKAAREPGRDLAALAGEMNGLTLKRALVAEDVQTLEREGAAAYNARVAEAQTAARERRIRELEGRRDALTADWAKWGAEMSAIDERLPALWAEYRRMAAEALDLGHEARQIGLELAPDTTPAGVVMGRILNGVSGLKDRRR